MAGNALTSIDDQVISDGCWLYNYVSYDADDEMLLKVFDHASIVLLCKHLESSSVQVQVPALKAIANALTCEEPAIADKMLFEGLLDRLLKLS